MSWFKRKALGRKNIKPENFPNLKVWVDSESNVDALDNNGINSLENKVGFETGIYTTGVKYRGINIAGAEYGNAWEGWTGQTFFTWRSSTALTNEMNYFGEKGFNCFRLPISWERLQHDLNGSFNSTYQTNLINYVNQATAQNWAVIVDLHNYNRYATGTHSSPGVQQAGYVQRIFGDGFLTNDHVIDVWVKLANLFIGNEKVIFNLMNESHDFPVTSTNYVTMINAQIAAIRATGATNLILVPNSRSSDVEHWSTYSPNGGPLDSVAFLDIVDSANNVAYDMHSYQANPTSSSSYSDLLSNVTNWAITNNKKLFLSEMGIPNTEAFGDVATGGALDYMNANSNVWIGWCPWNLPPYELTQFTPTQSYTIDGPSIGWYTPYLTPNTVSSEAVLPPLSSNPSAPLTPLNKNTRTALNSGVSDYWVFVPNAYDSTHNTPMKTLIWLHGCGGQGLFDVYHASVDFHSGSPGEVIYPTPQDYICVAVGGREGLCWQSTSSNIIAAAIADVKTKLNVDLNNVYIGGYSSGGDIGYLYAFNNSESIAGVLFQNTAPFSVNWGSSTAYTAATNKFKVVQLSALSDTTYPIANVRSQMDQLTAAAYPVDHVEVVGSHYDGPADYTPNTTWAAMRAELVPRMVSNSNVVQNLLIQAVSPNRPVWKTNIFKSGLKHSISFEGTPDYLTFSSPVLFDQGLTLFSSLKFTNVDTTTSTASNCPMTLFGHRSVSPYVSFGFSGGTLQYRYFHSATWNIYSSSITNLNDGLNHTIAVTHTTGGVLTFYIDGSPVNSFNSVIYNNSATFIDALGVGQNATDTFIGDASEFLIYNSPLVPQQIRDLHSRACFTWF